AARAAGPLTAANQPDRLVALEQVEANSRRLPARTGKPAVALEEQLRVALRDRRQSDHVLRSRRAKRLLAGLTRPEDFAGTTKPEILLGNPEAVVGLAHQRQPGAAHLGQAWAAYEKAGALPRAAPYAPTELVKLREPEALGALDDHQGRIGNVDPDLDHRRRNQHRELARRKARHHRILVRPLHAPVDQTDLVVAEALLEDAGALFSGRGVAFLAF